MPEVLQLIGTSLDVYRLVEIDPGYWHRMIEPGQRWQAKEATDDSFLVVGRGRYAGTWAVRTPIGFERTVTADFILNSYELADDDAEPAVEAGGEPVGQDAVEGPNSA